MTRFYKERNSHNIYQELISLSEQDNTPELEELTANTTDAAQEKHVPVITRNGSQVEVSVGSVAHPMLEEHFITGIYIETTLGGQYRRLSPSEEPKAVFTLADNEELIAAYEYCNLHGLWKAEA